MAIDLAVEFCGIKYRNPFLLASAPPTRPTKWEMIARAGWAGGITWAGTSSADGVPLVLLYAQSDQPYLKKSLPSWSCQFSSIMPAAQKGNATADAWKLHMVKDADLVRENVEQAKKAGLPVGANLLFGADTREWVQAARSAEQGGADILELNLSCPVYPMGVYLCKDLSKVSEIVRAVRGSTNLPIMAKLHAYLLPGDLKRTAIAVVEAGADAISATNMFHGIAGIDIETGMPVATDIDIHGNMRGMAPYFSGAAIKPFGLRAVAEIASAVDVPVSGMGGIANWQSAVEYMMLGATTVQVGMGAMLFGYEMVQDMTKGLLEFMERKGYRSPKDFIGIAHKKVTGIGEDFVSAARDLKRRNIVDEALCNGCGLCVRGCAANANGAMQMKNGVAWIDRNLCFNCNVCRLVCPTRAVKTDNDNGVS